MTDETLQHVRKVIKQMCQEAESLRKAAPHDSMAGCVEMEHEAKQLENWANKLDMAARLDASNNFYRERCHSLEAQIDQLYELAADRQRVS